MAEPTAGMEAVVAAHMKAAPMPAVAVGVVTPQQVVLRQVHGAADLRSGERATAEHRWDLASLTKTLVTLPEVLSLVDDGILALEEPIGVQWRVLAGRPVGRATLAQLLSYDAGLPASEPFYREVAGGPARVREAVLSTGLVREPGAGAVYSDIGAIILGELVSAPRGESLAVLAARRSGLVFGPVDGPVVATEQCAWRGRLIVGEVHDENAAALGGVAGHAGAFGTLDQVAAAVQAWMRSEVVSRDSHRAAVRQWSGNGHGERFGLGWWLANTRGLGGRSPGRDGWGMSGFVGNRIWVEPARGYGVVILSNRIHPERGDRSPFNRWCDGLLAAVARGCTDTGRLGAASSSSS